MIIIIIDLSELSSKLELLMSFVHKVNRFLTNQKWFEAKN